MRWCCGAFKGAFDDADERAFAIIVVRSDDDFAFILQHRALEPDDPGPANHPRPISTVSEIHIRFCPWCGVALADFYRQSAATMIRPDLKIREP